MLSTNRKSRTRIVGGAAAVGVLILTGLGVTASGTEAAEGIRAKVGKTIGVDLAAPVALAATPAIAASPRVQDDTAPAADDAPLPPVPAPPPVITVHQNDDATPSVAVTADGRNGDEGYKVVVRDRQNRVVSQKDYNALADLPEVSSRNCGEGDAKQMVINDQSGGKNRIVICEDRIANAAAKGAEIAANSAEIERNAYRSALAGLQGARAKVAADQRLNDEGRREALTSIDESIKEMQDDLAHAGEDD